MNYLKVVTAIIFIFGLIYILSPGPASINDFPPPPDSLKSDEPGDTYQVPNIAAYFSDFDRAKITQFYKKAFQNLYFFGLLPPIKLNHPPEYARQVIRNEQVSTFLEEYVYPFRGSLFVNGYEPFVENEMKKNNHNFVGDHIHIQGRYFNSKTTLRFYPADFFGRVVVYLGVWLAVFVLFEVGKRTFREA